MTACAASIARSALDDDELVDEAVEFVNRLTGRAYTRAELRTDATDPRLEQQLRGSLMLLLEDLTEPARLSLMGAIRDLGAASCSHDVHFTANWCTDMLGADRSIRGPRRR